MSRGHVWRARQTSCVLFCSYEADADAEAKAKKNDNEESNNQTLTFFLWTRRLQDSNLREQRSVDFESIALDLLAKPSVTQRGVWVVFELRDLAQHPKKNFFCLPPFHPHTPLPAHPCRRPSTPLRANDATKCPRYTRGATNATSGCASIVPTHAAPGHTWQKCTDVIVIVVVVVPFPSRIRSSARCAACSQNGIFDTRDEPPITNQFLHPSIANPPILNGKSCRVQVQSQR